MIDIQTGNIVKICGVMDTHAAHAAASAGADLLGFILAQGRREVAPGFVRSVRSSFVDGIEELPPIVGVMVNPDAATVARLFEEAGLDYLQLSGDESPDLLDDLDVPVIKTIHVAAGMTMKELVRVVDPWFDHQRPVIAIHIDAKLQGIYGGSGVQADWTVASQLAERYPSILAGGLKPGNVFEGIQSVAPRGVDVSSGVEIDGQKDATLIEAFVVRARQGFAPVSEDDYDAF